VDEYPVGHSREHLLEFELTRTGIVCTGRAGKGVLGAYPNRSVINP
jgi:hypothetical protein